jgi:hypothetical protein
MFGASGIHFMFIHAVAPQFSWVIKGAFAEGAFQFHWHL